MRDGARVSQSVMYPGSPSKPSRPIIEVKPHSTLDDVYGIIVGVLASLDRERACDCDAATNGLTPDPPHDLVGPG